MNWAQAFARQAESDLDAREVLTAHKSLPACHGLHFLQMACEKLCKASLIASGSDPIELQRSHAYIEKRLPIIVKDMMRLDAGSLPRNSWIVPAIRSLARKIELLSPAVKGGDRSPRNCEYPWPASDGSVIAPADYKFDFSPLFDPAGIRLLKLMRLAAAELQK
jgi:hypothetical protein